MYCYDYKIQILPSKSLLGSRPDFNAQAAKFAKFETAVCGIETLEHCSGLGGR